MKQIVIIHGGNSYSSNAAYLAALKQMELDYERLKPKKRWKQWLADHLPNDVDLLLPQMPNSSNASYAEWCIVFEKLLPHLRDGCSLVGHSLGGVFLARYLSENKLAIALEHLILIAAPYNDESSEELGEFTVSHFTPDTANIRNIHIFHSTDDPVVDYSEALCYKKDAPSAHLHTFSDKKHFNGEDFPELLAVLSEK